VRIVMLLTSLSAALVLLVAVSADYWIRFDGADHHYGLWNECKPNCDQWSGVHDWLDATRGCMVVAGIMFACAFVYYIAMTSSPKSFGSAMIAFLFSVAFIFEFGSLVVFTHHAQQDPRPHRFGWTYYTGWLSVIITVASAIIAFIDCRTSSPLELKKLEDEDEGNMAVGM